MAESTSAPKNTPGYNLSPYKTSKFKRPLTDLDLTFDLTSRIFAAMLVTFDLRFVFYAQNWSRNVTFWKWLFL